MELKINPAGLVAGVLMLLLPFLGPWWQASLGEIIRVQLSPFGYEINILGEPLSSTLFDCLLLGVKLSFLLGGALLLLGSLFPNKWWSRRLVRFGATKVLWLVTSLVCVLLAATPLLNRIVPSLAEGKGRLMFNLPYLSGSSVVEVSSEGVEMRVPLQLSFTWTFWLAVVVGALGLAARMMSGRMKVE
jgi:hypothetical protein